MEGKQVLSRSTLLHFERREKITRKKAKRTHAGSKRERERDRMNEKQEIQKANISHDLLKQNRKSSKRRKQEVEVKLKSKTSPRTHIREKRKQRTKTKTIVILFLNNEKVNPKVR